MKSDQYRNEPHFDKVDGPVYAGIGNQYVIPVDWAAVLATIRDLIPNEYVSIGQHIKALQQISQCQKKVSELKSVHNLLHFLEIALAQFELQIGLDVNKKKVLDIDNIEKLWRNSVVPKIGYLRRFALYGMKSLKPAFVLTENQIQGPRWILEIVQHQSDFETGLKDLIGDEEIYELSQTILQNCRDHMFDIDKELKDEIDSLAKISYVVLRSIDDGSTNS
jgi:hypothetical protein